jgi:hypothetical protein
MKNFSAWPLRTLCAFVFGALVFSGMAQADTELKFEKAVFYGDKGDQIGSAAAFGAGRLYVAGSDMVSDSKGLVASFSTPPASAPLSDFRWPDNQPSALSVSTEFSDIAVACTWQVQALPR